MASTTDHPVIVTRDDAIEHIINHASGAEQSTMVAAAVALAILVEDPAVDMTSPKVIDAAERLGRAAITPGTRSTMASVVGDLRDLYVDDSELENLGISPEELGLPV